MVGSRFILRVASPRVIAWMFSSVLVLLEVSGAWAAVTGKVQGKVVGSDTGEPVGFADIALMPLDSTMRVVGGLTNADGTYLLEAAAGQYALRVRALSYRTRRIESVSVKAGELLPVSVTLTPEAIQQKEVVVEARRRDNNEVALLTARRKASTVSDAVSAEQVRKAPDADAGQVLRRVTGTSTSSDGKYVFVRGMGDRYSSTEIDGVRVSSPELNKRTVPLDILPANLIENIVVQKSYTADRSGEFSGGDVQVHTKDFPGNRSYQITLTQGGTDGVTFKNHNTYASSDADLLGFGADSRKIPKAVFDVAGQRQLVVDPVSGFTRSALSQVAKSFADVWSPKSTRTATNATYAATFGDEYKIFGRPFGIVESANLSRSFDQRDEEKRFALGQHDVQYDYALKRATETVNLDGTTGLSYRLSPAHSLHVRGLYLNRADDEVRTYEGEDHTRVEATTGGWLVHRNTRLKYVQSNVLSGSLEGRHTFQQLLGSQIDWRFSRSRTHRQQPDRREVTYDRRYSTDPDGNLIGRWILGSTGSRQYGDMKENGWGTTIGTTTPLSLGVLGKGKIAFGYDRQTKQRNNFYRRFNIFWNDNLSKAKSPEEVFGPAAFTGQAGTGYVEDASTTLSNTDNYNAAQRVEAGFFSADLGLGAHVRSNIGLRYENRMQSMVNYFLFDPSQITSRANLENKDWLPTANVTWSVTNSVNLRMGASRTVSTPELDELSPSRPESDEELIGGYELVGNPKLQRTLLDNYDVRVEVFPGLSEVLAAGFFYKDLHHPIENVLGGGSPPTLIPVNSESGHNRGVELEARAGLERIWRRMRGLSVNSNASFISSVVHARNGTAIFEHPLQGQAKYLLNVTLAYTRPHGTMDAAVLVSSRGKQLYALIDGPLGNIYEEPITTVDATLGLSPFKHTRMKFAARNLTDAKYRRLQGDVLETEYRRGRGVSVSLSYGS